MTNHEWSLIPISNRMHQCPFPLISAHWSHNILLWVLCSVHQHECISLFFTYIGFTMRTLTVLLVLAVFTALAFGQNRRGQGAGRPARGQGRGPRTRNPKLLCSIESTNDEELNLPPGRMPNGECPGNSTCSLGPISVSQFGQEVELTFCDAVGDDGNLLIVSCWSFRTTKLSQVALFLSKESPRLYSALHSSKA